MAIEDPDYNPEEDTVSSVTEDARYEEEYEIAPRILKKRKFVATLTRDEREYFCTLPDDEKKVIMSADDATRKSVHTGVPLRFRILASDMDMSTKRLLLSRLDHFQLMREGCSEYFKMRSWFNAVCRLPFGRYKELPVSNKDSMEKIADYLGGVRKTLEQTVFGHEEAKQQIVQILAQWISNPKSKGNCIGIHGSMGVGKTMLVKEGICKALDLPFGFIALGGASDGAFLDGHGFTYEGSSYGKIAEIIMKTQVMNPVFFFDELDKVSSSHRGDEIIGILTHLTDSSQNERFCDKYFGEIELDLSKSLIVFSYNDETLINPILKDRMITIHVDGYNKKEKMVIASKYLMPTILQQFGFKEHEVSVDDEAIEYIINTVPEEDGVRNLKRGLESVLSSVNLLRYTKQDDNNTFKFPFTVTSAFAKKCLKNKSFARSDVATRASFASMYT